MITEFMYQDIPHKLELSSDTLRGRDNSYYYTIMIDNYWYGRMFKHDGIWFPLDQQNFTGHNLFRLEASDYQVLGEIIETEL